MAQASFPFDAIAPAQRAAAAAAARNHDSSAPSTTQRSMASDPVAFDIGWDFALHRLTPPLAHLHPDSPVHQGWRAGRSAFGLRTLRATPAVRTWLQLRLAAWLGGQPFEELQVTPHWLRQIEVDSCPVKRGPLRPGPGEQAVVTRAFEGAAWAAGNLVTISESAHQARGRRGWEQAVALARQIESGIVERIDGLNSTEWMRLGVLMSLATPLPHAVAAGLPLVVLPPNRMRVQNPVQALQVMLTLQFTRPGYARRLVMLAAWIPGAEARQVFQVFMHTLLARRLTVAPGSDANEQRRAMEDSWTDALVQRRWQRLSLRLTAAQCEQLLERATRRGVAGHGVVWLSTACAMDGWGLESGGLDQVSATPDMDADFVAGTTPEPTPGSARSTGSQKLASCVAVTACGTFQ